MNNTINSSADVLWQPDHATIAATWMEKFRQVISNKYQIPVADYTALHQWSCQHNEQFWAEIWQYCSVIGESGERACVPAARMQNTQWFPDARLNFAENLLERGDAHAVALRFSGEGIVKRNMTRAELKSEVARFAQLLVNHGVVAGDRVAAMMPNMPETIVAMLAATSLGAVFTSASPDFGVQGVVDRFGQVEPKILLCCDGYYYNGKTVDCSEKLLEIIARLPTLKAVYVVSYISSGALKGRISNGHDYAEAIAWQTEKPLNYLRLPFNHPLFIMYSSGTTGVPKCIVHGAGGTLLQHLKEHRLHSDVRVGDRLFFFTTCGWMMWSWLVSGLASEAELLLYDGSPFAGDSVVLFDYLQKNRVCQFGTSAKFIDALKKAEKIPKQTHPLPDLRLILSTGSPLVGEAFDYVYQAMASNISLASISGGTDILSCFVLGNPCAPVIRGEIQCAGLGMAVEVWDDDGRPAGYEKGELVCTNAFVSMPIGFWRDDNQEKYQAAYFERFIGVWCHGDFCQRTANGGYIIHGRSDATLNPGGVRIGTAEIYRQVESLDEVVESVVVSQDWPPESPADVRVVLFVVLKPGLTLDATLTNKIKNQVRQNTTPRHVPAKVLQVGQIPRTKSGKIVELAIRNIIHNRLVKNIDALANPEALDEFANRAELITE